MTDDLKHPSLVKFITIKNARITATHFDDDNPHHWQSPYFLAETEGGELHRIRVHSSGEDRAKFESWIHARKNKNDMVDIVVFPYKWVIPGKQSGVVYFFQNGKVSGE